MLTTNVLLTPDISNIDNYPIVFKNIVLTLYGEHWCLGRFAIVEINYVL